MQTFKHAHNAPAGAWGLHMNILLISALLLGGCKANDPIATPLLNTDYSIVDGDTIKTVINKDYKKAQALDPNGKNYITVGDTIMLYKEPKLHTPPTKDPDLSKLKNNDDPDLKGKPLRMVAIGGSLTAGVRDGGYFNEGILTSYPNLIARQMKLKKFEQPLFDASDYNGFGRKVRTGFNPTGGPVPKFNEVKNNSGVEDANGIKVKLKQAKNLSSLDNFAIPFMNEGSLMIGSDLIDSDRKDLSSFENSIFTKRLIPADKKVESLVQHINSSKYDLMIIDVWTDNFIKGASIGSIGVGATGYLDGTSYTDKILSKIIDGKKSKMALVNIPDILEFPYFKIMTNELLILGMSGQKYIYYRGGSQPELITQTDRLHLPTSTFDSLASTKVHISLKKGLTELNPINSNGQLLVKAAIEGNKSRINNLNIIIQKSCEKFGFALVDLNSLYKKILTGRYSEDGVLIDPSYPNGNFFSSDGFYPTALGQAVIANEFIRSINATYKTDIPLIKISEYTR
ncbi:MAG: hypothetical protein U5M51_08770 [Emticicia sp.]|nr:hypothetical protein [Emticicia sp.]